MIIETLNNYKVIVADENKILVLPDETLCSQCYTPLNFDTNTIIKKDYVAEETEASAVEVLQEQIDDLSDMVCTISVN